MPTLLKVKETENRLFVFVRFPLDIVHLKEGLQRISDPQLWMTYLFSIFTSAASRLLMKLKK